MIQENKSATISTHQDQTLFQPVCIEGNGSRPSHRGDGYKESETMYTLNTTEVHAVAFEPKSVEYHQQDDRIRYREDDTVQTLSSHMGTGGNNVPLVQLQEYIVRRLTPLECCRLQAFPDSWCDGLETENPTDEDIEFWTDVFETHRKVISHSKKPKTKKQIEKWLKNPHTDAAEYKMWGNGVALPNVAFVMSGIAWWEEQKKSLEKKND